MILEEETYVEFGYYPSELTPHSGKKILAACDECGKVRIAKKHHYHALCKLCAHKGMHHSEETKKRLSEAGKGNKNALGQHHTEEAKKKMSEAKSGKNHPNYGKHRSEETRKKISDAHKGKKLSEKTKRKLSEANKGKHHSEETKKKISEAQKNQSEETKAKMREVRKCQKFPKHRTKPERIWQEIAIEKHSLPFKYTGDGAFWIGENPAINPDFIHLTKKIAVEIFSYWHDPLQRNGKVRYSHTYEGRKKILKKRGWKLIVFWQDDLEREDAEQFVLTVLEKEGVIK